MEFCKVRGRILMVAFLVGSIQKTVTLDAICERIDFNDFTQSRITECSGSRKEIFRLARYSDSQLFKPYRENVQYYLSNDIIGISCGETIESFYMHEYTEIRLVYQLLYRTPSTLTLRILDMDQLEGGLPKVAQRWSSQNETNTWSLFQGRVQQEIKRAKLQIEVDITVGANIAIEYITVFNSLVQEQFCKDLDELYTSPAATTPTTTTTIVPTTTTTTTARPTTRTTTTTTPRPTTTTRRMVTRTTTSSTTTTTLRPTTTSTTQPPTTTTSTTSTIRPTRTRTTTASTTLEPTTTPPVDPDINPTTHLPATLQPESGAIWIALTGVFITLTIMASATALYIHCNTRQLNRVLADQFGVHRSTAPPKNTNHHANNHLAVHVPPLDRTIHRKLQQQLKNRLQQQQLQHQALEYEEHVEVTRHSSKYPPRHESSVNVNLNRPTAAATANAPRKGGDFSDDISEIKFKNRTGKY